MIERQFIFLITCLVIQEEEVAGGIDVVQVVLRDIIGTDGSVRLNEVIDEILCECEVALIAGHFIQRQECCNHAAVNVVPFVLLSAENKFLVPHRFFCAGVIQKILDVLVDLVLNFVFHSSFSSSVSCVCPPVS